MNLWLSFAHGSWNCCCPAWLCCAGAAACSTWPEPPPENIPTIPCPTACPTATPAAARQETKVRSLRLEFILPGDALDAICPNRPGPRCCCCIVAGGAAGGAWAGTELEVDADLEPEGAEREEEDEGRDERRGCQGGRWVSCCPLNMMRVAISSLSYHFIGGSKA
jgi:hypothetical protein